MGTENLPELLKLGFKNVHIQAWLAKQPELSPARVSSVERGFCTVLLPTPKPLRQANPELDAICSIQVRPSKDEPTAVGDWVLLDPLHEHPRVLSILPRTSLLARGAAGPSSSSQPIAANVDVVLVVAAAAASPKMTRRGLNPRRIERYVLAAQQAGAQPVIVINKCDLATESDIDDVLGSRLRHVDLIRTSALSDHPFEEVSRVLEPETTAVLVGPSGVGKSTITNALIGNSAVVTNEVRSGDSKGRHTTTRRSMHRLSTGALLIDTPGMREFGVTSAEGILELAKACRFSDCTHKNEPGCAVQEAIESGELCPDWVRDQLALKEEALRHEARRDAYSRHLLNKKGKEFAGLIRETKALKRKKLR